MGAILRLSSWAEGRTESIFLTFIEVGELLLSAEEIQK